MGDHVASIVEQWQARRPALDLTGMAVFGRVARLARLADLRRSEVLAAHQLQAGDVDVLSPLWRAGTGLRPLELRRAMMIGSATLTARLDRLEAAGLLERRSDPDDRRGRRVFLTDAGARLVPQVVAALLEVENELLRGVPASLRSRLADDLGRLLDDLEADPNPDPG